MRKRFLISVCVIVFTTVLSNNTAKAQGCFEYHKGDCDFEETNFKYQLNKSSVSFKFASGEIRTIAFEMNSGKDYRLLLCADEVFEDIISLKIISEEGVVIYDNSTNNYELNMEFVCKKSQRAEIEIAAPDPASGVSDTIYSEGCIGMKIEEMISIRTGF